MVNPSPHCRTQAQIEADKRKAEQDAKTPLAGTRQQRVAAIAKRRFPGLPLNSKEWEARDVKL